MPSVLPPPASFTKLTLRMATRVRTASIWVPPLQEGENSCDRIRKLQVQESILGQRTPDHRPLPGSPWQKQKSYRTEQVLEWLFISQEKLKITKSWVIYAPNLILSSNWNEEKSCGWYMPKSQVRAIQIKSGKLMTISNGIRKTKAIWEVWQKAMNVLHLENYVFLVKITFLHNKNLINAAYLERV
ncbi:zinc finger protein 268 isoform X2 [Otolemur garnettii]|uniref:zinc finger protein 268 isoform X2 n=1 Tax=Otolemur garnettii TaxID=30611 RepID=UPI000C7EAF27|nr:zinc finger protein 268 isoform X2 [Otolemur garnettii]